MAEAYLNSKNPATAISSSNSSKKRKSEATASMKLKRPNVTQMAAVPIASTTSNSSQSSLLKSFHQLSTTSAAASSVASSSSIPIQPSENAISNQDTLILRKTVGEIIRKPFFIGGQKYVIFGGKKVL